MDPSPKTQNITRLVVKAWSDSDFRQRLLTDPKQVFNEEGIAVPEGQEVVVLEDSSQKAHFVIPQCPDDLAIEELDVIGQSDGTDTITDYHCGGGCNPIN